MSWSSRRKRLRSQRGVSLVEVMVSAVIFAIVAVALVEFFSLGRAYIKEGGLRRNGLALVQQKIEELRALSLSDAALVVGNHGPEGVQLSEGLVGSRHWSVTWQDDPANGISASDQDYKAVMVRVTWLWEQAHEDTVSLGGRFYP